MTKLHAVLALAATALAFTLGTPTSAFSQSHRGQTDPCAGLRGWDYAWCADLRMVHRLTRRISRRHAKDEKRRIVRRDRNIDVAVEDVIYSMRRAALDARLRRAHAQSHPRRAVRHSTAPGRTPEQIIRVMQVDYLVEQLQQETQNARNITAMLQGNTQVRIKCPGPDQAAKLWQRAASLADAQLIMMGCNGSDNGQASSSQSSGSGSTK